MSDQLLQYRDSACNRLKRTALRIFAERGALNPPAWAVFAGFHPIRSSYTYLLRLHRYGLLNRSRNRRGLIMYSLSERGYARLAWLESRKG